MSKRSDLFALLFLVAWPLVYFWPVTLGQQVFSEGDINWLFLPIRTELTRALAQGRLPLWSPGLEAGFPIFAEGEIAALYPLNLLAYRLLPPANANSIAILFNLAWASAGMYLLARSSALRPAAALLAGFVFGLSGFMVAQVSHLPHETVAAWLPWLVLCQFKYWQAGAEGKNQIPWFVLAALCIGVQWLGGFPQIALFNLMVYGAAGLLGPLLWKSREADAEQPAPFRTWLPKAALVTFGSIVLGTALAAVQLIPSAELIGLSIRGAEVGRSFFTSYSLDPAFLSQFIFPFWQMGVPDAGNMEYWGYVGILPLLLALLAPVLRREARTWFFVALAVLALVLALGGNTFVYDWLYYIPVFNRFRVPARFLLLFTFATAFLAAVGFEGCVKRLDHLRWTGWKSWGPALLALVLVAATLYQAYNRPLESWTQVWQKLPVALILISAGALFLALSRRIDSRAWSALALGLALFDFAAFWAPFLPNLARTSPPADLVQVPRTVQAMDQVQPVYRVVVDKTPYTQAAIRASLWKNLPLLYDKQGVKSYLPSLGLDRNNRYIQEMSLPMRDLMNIRYYLLPLEVFDAGDPVPPPFDTSEPYGGLTLELLGGQPAIPPTRVSRIEVVSYTGDTRDLTNGTVAGDIVLGLNGASRTLPIRLGSETADWAFDGLRLVGKMSHDKPANVLSFPAYLQSVGRTFDGHKYVATYDVASGNAPLTVTSVGARSFLPGAGLTIESIRLVDETGHSVSLAALLNRGDLALAFRSHTAAMWENASVLPRAFMVHAAQVVTDEEALARMQQPGFHPAEIALLSDGQAASLANSTLDDVAEPVTISEYKPERVTLKVQVNRPGYLMLTDSWYPGWAAAVDGQPTPIARADYIFRAVYLLPGQHTVVFEYRPESFMWGAAISALALVILSFTALLAAQRANFGFLFRTNSRASARVDIG